VVYFGGFVDKLGYFAGFFYILFAGRYSEAAMGGAGDIIQYFVASVAQWKGNTGLLSENLISPDMFL
jgi:hypothetical protein